MMTTTTTKTRKNIVTATATERFFFVFFRFLFCLLLPLCDSSLRSFCSFPFSHQQWVSSWFKMDFTKRESSQ